MIDHTSHQEKNLPHDSEPQPKWPSTEVFLNSIREFTDKEKNRYIPFFEQRYPDLTKEEYSLAAECLARMMFLCLVLNDKDEAVQTKLSIPIQDIRVAGVTEPILSLDGKVIDTITDVPDERLHELVHVGSTIFFNTNAIVFAITTLGKNSLESFFVPFEKTAVEEVAHVSYIEWSAKDPKRWLELLQELKKLNQKTSFTRPEYIKPEDFSDYYNTGMEKHGRDWVASYEEHFYPPHAI